jgi:hypothetical protein
VTAGAGGSITIAAARAILNGQLRAVAQARDEDGGFIDIATRGDLVIGGGGIVATGGNRWGFGGFCYLIAEGDIEIGGLVEMKGGDGGDVDIDTLGDLHITAIGSINNIAAFEGNDGGDVRLAGGGVVTIEGPIYTNGQGSLSEGGGWGGDLDVSGRRVVLAGEIELTGAGPDGDGGFLDVTADEDLLVTGRIDATGAAEASGGEVNLLAGTLVAVDSLIDIRGGFTGGAFSVLTNGPVAIGGSTRIDADVIPGSIFGSYGGMIDIAGCDVTVGAGSVLTCLGTGGGSQALMRIAASGAMTIGGSLNAGAQITLEYRTLAPTLLGSAILQPAPTMQQNAALPCCIGCPTTTSTSTTSSTTTSTSSTSSTTTSSSSSTTATTASTTTSTSSTTSSTSSSSTSSTTTSSSSSTTATTASTTISTSSTTSSTSSSSTSSTTTSSSSSTTTTVTSSTTSTTLPLTCLDEPLEGYAAVECAIGHLEDMVASQSDDALGGLKSAKRLAGKIVKTSVLVEKSRTSSRAAKLLVKAERKVLAFETQIERLLDKAKIDDGLATALLDLSGEVTVRIDAVLAPLAN